jgi:hypothetical protein
MSDKKINNITITRGYQPYQPSQIIKQIIKQVTEPKPNVKGGYQPPTNQQKPEPPPKKE